MARESRPPDATGDTSSSTPSSPTSAATPAAAPAQTTTTPTSRRAFSAEPATASAGRGRRRSITIRTPGTATQNRPQQPRNYNNNHLTASARKPPPASATPHARAAFRTIDSRRAAAISTPHRQGGGAASRRRSGRGEARETPRNFLLPLGRALARNTKVIVSSSSSSAGRRSRDGDDRDRGTKVGFRDYDDDDDEDELPKRPRLSLPIGDEEEGEDDDELRPHRSAGLEDENFTMQSIEMPRRAYSEQPGGRFSFGSVRMSDYFEAGEEGLLRSDDVGIDSGFFPPVAPIEEADEDGMLSFERSELDARREPLARESDFGIEVPLDMNESTVVLAPQLGESPTRQIEELFEPIEELFEPMMDQRSDDYDDDEGLPEEEAAAPAADSDLEEVEVETVAAKSNAKRSVRKKTTKLSKHGIKYPSLPQGVVKRLATTFAKNSGSKGKITSDTLQAIMQASDWFFEQLGDDLEAYSNHAHRKTIDESDMLTLMRRQRQTSTQMTPFALAQRHLPRELLQELRMAPPAPPKKRRKANHEAEDQDVT